jgi:mannose-6-phosphate isomerase-like protein (cupin superfamily)
MKLARTQGSRGRFNVVAMTAQLQAAMMSLRGDEKSDEELCNEHPRSEQWLFVISGKGTATVIPKGGRRRTIALRPGSLLIIQRGEKHQIKNAGHRPLRTINFYSPPAYQKNGTLRPSQR